jgi:hypothetical protein
MANNLLQEALGDSRLRVLALDPGETTGACVFDGPDLIDARQLSTGLMPDAAYTVYEYLSMFRTSNAVVVIEDYRVYSWKTKDHAWAGLHTPRLIGAVEYICRYNLDQLPLVKQTAQQGKGFCTDDKLKAWGVYQINQKHARDAIRHACYYLLFTIAKLHIPTTGGKS